LLWNENLNKSETSLTVLLIATRNYISYAKNLLSSLERFLAWDTMVQVVVFTDDSSSFKHCEPKNKLVLDVIQIASYGWPDATLMRFHVFEEHWNIVKGRRVMYLDADTRVVNLIDELKFMSMEWACGVALVKHPGYYNRGPRIGLANSLIGHSWETNRLSCAFVPIYKRRNYVCGGVWMGENLEIKLLVSVLKNRIQADLDQDVIAKYHDESHLNKWASCNRHTQLSPKWAFAADYSWLNDISPLIEVIHKPTDFIRKP